MGLVLLKRRGVGEEGGYRGGGRAMQADKALRMEMPNLQF